MQLCKAFLQLRHILSRKLLVRIFQMRSLPFFVLIPSQSCWPCLGSGDLRASGGGGGGVLMVGLSFSDTFLGQNLAVSCATRLLLLVAVADELIVGSMELAPLNASNIRVQREPRDNYIGKLDVLGKKDAQFGRTTSFGDADVLEPSFSGMLKSKAKKLPASQESRAPASGASELSDGMLLVQGPRSHKKNGKKGRQIDPALLGFKVTNIRIVMGEIQGLED